MKNYIKDMREKIGHKPIVMSGVGLIIYKDNKIWYSDFDGFKWCVYYR